MEDLKSKINRIRNQLKPTQYKKKFNFIDLIIELIAGILVGAVLGYNIDSYFKTMPLFLFLFIVFGLLGAIFNINRKT